MPRYTDVCVYLFNRPFNLILCLLGAMFHPSVVQLLHSKMYSVTIQPFVKPMPTQHSLPMWLLRHINHVAGSYKCKHSTYLFP